MPYSTLINHLCELFSNVKSGNILNNIIDPIFIIFHKYELKSTKNNDITSDTLHISHYELRLIEHYSVFYIIIIIDDIWKIYIQ